MNDNHISQGHFLRRSFFRTVSVLLLSALAIHAEDLTGRVMDPDGLAVSGARVSLVNRTSGALWQTTTSPNGAYSFTGVSAGSYLIEAEASGAALSGSQRVTLSGDTNLDLRLGFTTSVTEVVVTATGTPLSQQEIAKVIDVVDIKQITERDEYSLAEALRTVPGVQIQTQVGGVTQIKTRGLRNQDTAVLIDGLRFRDAAATQGDASGFLSDMNIVDMGRAEYLRGSGSSLYGSNAIAGAVSLNSNEGGGSTHGALRAEGGQLGMMRGTANLAGGLWKDKFVYSGGFSHLNVTGGVRGNTPNRNNSAQWFSKVNLAPGISLSGRFWGADVFQRAVVSAQFPSSIRANFPATGVVKAVPLPDDQIELFEKGQPFNAGNATFIPSIPDTDGSRGSSFRAGALIFKQELAPDTSWRFSYQGVATKRAFWNGPAGTTGFEPITSEVSNFNGRTDLVQIRLDTKAGDWNLITMGYEMESEGYDSVAQRAIGAAGTRIGLKQVSHSYYGQDQLRLLNDRLQLTFGGRVQHFQLSNPRITGSGSPYDNVPVNAPPTAYTGDISAAYFFEESNTKLRGHIGNSYRAPSLYERYGASVFQGFFSFYGDPRMSPEKSVAFDAGVDQWLFHEKVRASATYFYTDLSETIIFSFTNFPPNDPFGRFGGYRNSQGGGISRGVELSTQLSPTSKTTLQMSYTYVNADQRTPTIGSDFFQVLRNSNHILSLTGTQRITSRLSATADFYALSDTYESPFGAGGRRLQFAGPKKTDLVINYNLPLSDARSVDIYGKMENIFDVRYTDNGFLAPGAWGIAGLKFNF